MNPEPTTPTLLTSEPIPNADSAPINSVPSSQLPIAASGLPVTSFKDKDDPTVKYRIPMLIAVAIAVLLTSGGSLYFTKSLKHKTVKSTKDVSAVKKTGNIDVNLSAPVTVVSEPQTSTNSSPTIASDPIAVVKVFVGAITKGNKSVADAMQSAGFNSVLSYPYKGSYYDLCKGDGECALFNWLDFTKATITTYDYSSTNSGNNGAVGTTVKIVQSVKIQNQTEIKDYEISVIKQNNVYLIDRVDHGYSIQQ